MNLVKEIKTLGLFIDIYSVNPNLIVSDDASRFQNKSFDEIKDIVFNEIGAEQVVIKFIGAEGQVIDSREYSIL
jgi:hypothetical protein